MITRLSMIVAVHRSALVDVDRWPTLCGLAGLPIPFAILPKGCTLSERPRFQHQHYANVLVDRIAGIQRDAIAVR
jgi:hypothetical protein